MSPLQVSGPGTEKWTTLLRLPLVSGVDTEEQTSSLFLPPVSDVDTEEQTSPLCKNQETTHYQLTIQQGKMKGLHICAIQRN